MGNDYDGYYLAKTMLQNHFFLDKILIQERLDPQ